MIVRILQPVGEWSRGQQVDLADRRANGLVQTGYAERVTGAAAPEQAMAETDDGRGRPTAGRRRETRG